MVRIRRSRRAGCITLSLACLAWLWAGHGRAQDLTEKDVQIAGRAMGFVRPAPSGDAVVAVVYQKGDAAGGRAADTIAGYFGDGIEARGVTLHPRVIDSAALAAGTGFAAIIMVGTIPGDLVMTASRGQHILCITGDIQAVEVGRCAMGVSSAGKVDIVVNRAAASSAGLSFAAAFRMMIREL